MNSEAGQDRPTLVVQVVTWAAHAGTATWHSG